MSSFSGDRPTFAPRCSNVYRASYNAHILNHVVGCVGSAFCVFCIPRRKCVFAKGGRSCRQADDGFASTCDEGLWVIVCSGTLAVMRVSRYGRDEVGPCKNV